MGSYRFKWPHAADEVLVTGTFDNWSKSIKLDKKQWVHEKVVDIPETKDEVLYKFVVNGQWRTDPSHAVKKDHEGNENNVLDPEDIIPSAAGAAMLTNIAPGATTTQLAGDQPIEDKTPSLPGAFPETPGETPSGPTLQDRLVGVNPIPATGSMGNPITLKPGEKVPDPSTITNNTVQSTATTSREAYESGAGGAAYSPAGKTDSSAALFGRPAAGGTIIPESSLPMGDNSDISQRDYTDPAISSVGAGSTTAALAGQQPIEPRGTPQVISKSEEEKEDEKKDDGIAGKVAAGGALAAVGVGGTTAALAGQQPTEPRGTPQVISKSEDEKKDEDVANKTAAGGALAGVGAGSTTTALAGQQPVEPRGTPQVVSKNEDEKTDEKKDEGIAGKAAAGAAVAGVAVAGAAVAANEAIKDKTGKDPVSALPQSTQDAVHENAKESNIPAKAGVTGGSSGETAAASVPSDVAESQKEANFAPEASANAEAVQEKSEVEKELLEKVPVSNESGEPAPTASAASATTAPAATSGTGAPQLGDPTNGGLAPISMDDKPTEPAAASSSAAHTTPMVTTGVADSPAPQVSTPQKRHSIADRLKSHNRSQSQSSVPTTPVSTTSKKEKRRSIFQRIKDKLSS